MYIEAHGHAFHHCFWYYQPEQVLFSGDGLGFCFDELKKCPLLCTSPSQFDSVAWRKTVQKVQKMELKAIQPTHFKTFTKNFEK